MEAASNSFVPSQNDKVNFHDRHLPKESLYKTQSKEAYLEKRNYCAIEPSLQDSHMLNLDIGS